MNQTLKKVVRILTIVLFTIVILWGGYKLFIEGSVLFQKDEKLVLDAGKHYYEVNPKLLPTKEKDVKTVSIATLYEKKMLEDIFIPKTKKLCNSETSFVKVEKIGDDYTYHVYLDCGKYQSKVDHVGPNITLNGDSVMTVSLGSTFTDPGIQSVVDQTDGKMDPHLVEVQGEVETNTLGSYKLTYTVYDYFKNKSVVERTVHVVRHLKDEIKKTLGDQKRYVGMTDDNYVWYSGFLWRIVDVTDKDTLRLITDDVVTTLAWGESNKTEFDTSDMKQWLNGYFLSNLKDSSHVLVEHNDWCMKDPSTGKEDVNRCATTTKATVGMLSLEDYTASLDEQGNSYLQGTSSYAFNTISRWSYPSYHYVPEGDVNYPTFSKKIIWNVLEVVGGIRPVIHVKAESTVYGGTGTKDDPYILEAKSESYSNQFLNTRMSGEYVRFSDLDFRIVHINKDGTVKLILNQMIYDEKAWDVLTTVYDKDGRTTFLPEDSKNAGHFLNTTFASMINIDKVVTSTFNTSPYDPVKGYTKMTGSSVKAKVGLMTIGEMFTSQPDYTYVPMWTLTPYAAEKESSLYSIEESYGIIKETDNMSYYYANETLRPVISLNKQIKIIGGSGTKQDPFIVR